MTPVHVMSFMKKITIHDVGITEQAILMNIWIYFNLIGNTILLPLVVLTFLCSKHTKRHPTLVNLCTTWIFSGVFSLLLFYTKQHSGPEPSNMSLCIAQASLLYGITPMWSVAVFAMFYYMVYTLKGGVGSSMLGGNHMIVMLSAPYIAQCSFTIAALVIALHRPESIKRELRYFFCSLPDKTLFFTMTLFTLVMCIGIFVLEIMLAVTMYMNWRTMRNIGVSNRLDLPLIMRVLLFGVYVAFGMAINVTSMFGNFIIVDMYAATAGTVVYLIFGTQSDVIRAWCFWKKCPPPRHSTLLPPSTYCLQDFDKNSSFRLSNFTSKSRKSVKTILILSHLHSGPPSSSIPPPLPSKDSWLMGTFLNLNTEDSESVKESMLKRGVPEIGEPPRAFIFDYRRRKSSGTGSVKSMTMSPISGKARRSGLKRISEPIPKRSPSPGPSSAQDYQRRPNNHQRHSNYHTVLDTEQQRDPDSETDPELRRHPIDSNFLHPQNPSISLSISENQGLQDITTTGTSSKRPRTHKSKPKGPRKLSISSPGGSQLGHKSSTLSSTSHPTSMGNGSNPIEPSSLSSIVSQNPLRTLPDIPIPPKVASSSGQVQVKTINPGLGRLGTF